MIIDVCYVHRDVAAGKTHMLNMQHGLNSYIVQRVVHLRGCNASSTSTSTSLRFSASASTSKDEDREGGTALVGAAEARHIEA